MKRRDGSFICAILLPILLLFGCSRSSGPHPEIVTSSACENCAIDIRTVWSSRAGDDNILGEGWPLEVGDTLWMMGESFGPAIARLPLDGGAGTLFERKGDGPGEFRWISAGQVHPSGDTVVIVQDTRVSYVTADLREVRSFANIVPKAVGLIVLQNGTLISAKPALSKPAGAVGYALHQTSPEGEYRGSFRPANSPYKVGLWPMSHGLEPNTIWVVEPRSSGLIAELWDVGRTERLRVLRVNPDWWVSETKTPEDYERMGGRKDAVPTLPTGTVGVWDSGDVLWVALRHFDARRPNVDFADDAAHKWFDGVLLALDRDSSIILAAAVFDEFLLGFTNRGKLVLYDEDRNEQPRVRLAEASLRRAR